MCLTHTLRPLAIRCLDSLVSAGVLRVYGSISLPLGTEPYIVTLPAPSSQHQAPAIKPSVIRRRGLTSCKVRIILTRLPRQSLGWEVQSVHSSKLLSVLPSTERLLQGHRLPNYHDVIALQGHVTTLERSASCKTLDATSINSILISVPMNLRRGVYCYLNSTFIVVLCCFPSFS